MERRSTLHLHPAQPRLPHGEKCSAGLSRRAWLALAAITALVPALLFWRLRLTGKSGHLSTTGKDLLLAWSPLPMAWLLSQLAARKVVRHRRLQAVSLWALGAAWLLFFPNSPYLITELLHLDTRVYGPSNAPAPAWLHFATGDGPFRAFAPSWLDLLFLVAVAACGVMLTFASLRLVHGVIARRLPRRPAAAAVCGLILLASFGVALGRFERFNSWHVFKKPEIVADRILTRLTHPEDSPDVTGWTLGLAAVLSIGYFGLREVGPPTSDDMR